jgi:hypothetical protein
MLKLSVVNMNAEQKRFLIEEFLTMAINGALQHNPTYLKSASEKDQENFRKELRREIKNIAAAYKTTVEAKTQVLNIQNWHCPKSIKSLPEVLVVPWPHSSSSSLSI